jgi:hypothetical protein
MPCQSSCRGSIAIKQAQLDPVICCFQSPEERGLIIQVLENAYRFTLGSIGGGKFMWVQNISCQHLILTENLLFTIPTLPYFPQFPQTYAHIDVGLLDCKTILTW